MLLQPLAARVYWYVTAIGTDVIFLNVSLGLFAPNVGPAGVIPAIAALVQLNVVPAVALAGG